MAKNCFKYLVYGVFCVQKSHKEENSICCLLSFYRNSLHYRKLNVRDFDDTFT